MTDPRYPNDPSPYLTGPEDEEGLLPFPDLWDYSLGPKPLDLPPRRGHVPPTNKEEPENPQ